MSNVGEGLVEIRSAELLDRDMSDLRKNYIHFDSLHCLTVCIGNEAGNSTALLERKKPAACAAQPRQVVSATKSLAIQMFVALVNRRFPQSAKNL